MAGSIPGRPRRRRSGTLVDRRAGGRPLRGGPALRLSRAPADARHPRWPPDRDRVAGARPAGDAHRRARPAHPDRRRTRLPLARVRRRRHRAHPPAGCRRVDQPRARSRRPCRIPVPCRSWGRRPSPASCAAGSSPGRWAGCGCRRRSCPCWSWRSSRTGIPALGYFAQVPHYVSGPYPGAALALLRSLGHHLGLDLPEGDLPDESRQLRSHLDSLATGDATTRAYVERLESMVDEERLP